MKEYALQLVYGLFGSTIILALFMAAYQYYHERKKIYFYSFLYWTAALLSSIVNGLVSDIESHLYLFSFFATFTSQLILSFVITEIRGLKLNTKKLIIFCISFFIAGEILRFFNFSFEVYTTISLFGAVLPVFYSLYLVFKNKTTPFTSAQKMFYFFCFLLTMHYLDYAYFRAHSELFVLALSAAFFLIHVISSLMPMVVNEYHLYVRNLNLEKEIEERVLEIRKKDQQLWESHKLEVIGRLSGELAHELNTPLSAISIAISSIRKHLESEVVDKIKVTDKLEKIRLVLQQIISITSVLRSASGDLKKENLSILDLKEVFKENLQQIQSYCQERNIEFTFQSDQDSYLIHGDKNELIRAIKALIINTAQTLKEDEKPWIKMSLKKDSSSCYIYYSDSRDKKKSLAEQVFSKEPHQALNLTVNLDIIVIKSIIENHQGQINFDFDNHNQRVNFRFPLSEGPTL